MVVNVSNLSNQLRMQGYAKNLNTQIAKLSKEVSTGSVGDYFGDLRARSHTSISLRADMSEINYYKEASSSADVKLETMQNSITQMKDLVLSFRDQLIRASSDTDKIGPRFLADFARGAIDQIGSMLNVSVAGQYILSGVESDKVPMVDFDETNPRSGLSPKQVVAQLQGNAGPLTSVAAAKSFVDQIDMAFGGTHPTTELNFSETLYDGAATGSVKSLIDKSITVDLGFRADDPAIREALSSFYIMAQADYTGMPEDAFSELVAQSMERLTGSLEKMTNLSGNIGARQAMVKDVKDRHDASFTLLNNLVADIEGIDGFKAATQLTSLQTQLQATYTLTSRLDKLSLVNYM